MRLSNLAIRLTTAALVTPLVLLVLFFGPELAWFSLVLVCLAGLGAELYRLSHPGDRLAQVVLVGLTVAVSCALYFDRAGRLVTATLLSLPVAAMLLTLWRFGELPSAGFRMAMAVMGPLYLGGLLTTLALLRRDLGELGKWYVLMALSFAWFGDAGAYFAGKRFGRRKLYPAISPAKTVEGLYGAVVGAIAGAFWAHFIHLPSIPLLDAILLAMACGVLGQLGDLGESLLKRACGAKDSGWIVPGHGGLLDRVDALLVVGGIVYLYVLLLRADRIPDIFR